MHSSSPRCTCWRQDVGEVERLLGVMRNQARQQAFRGVSLGTLRWHVLAWYVNVDRVASWHPVKLRRGKRPPVASGQQVLRDREGRWVPAVRVEHPPRRDPQAREARALDGVAWMAERWSLGHEPMLPAEEAA